MSPTDRPEEPVKRSLSSLLGPVAARSAVLAPCAALICLLAFLVLERGATRSLEVFGAALTGGLWGLLFGCTAVEKTISSRVYATPVAFVVAVVGGLLGTMQAVFSHSIVSYGSFDETSVDQATQNVKRFARDLGHERTLLAAFFVLAVPFAMTTACRGRHIVVRCGASLAGSAVAYLLWVLAMPKGQRGEMVVLGLVFVGLFAGPLPLACALADVLQARARLWLEAPRDE